MYIQLKDFNSYMSPQNKDRLFYFCSVISLYTSKMVQHFTPWCKEPHGATTAWVLAPCGDSLSFSVT